MPVSSFRFLPVILVILIAAGPVSAQTWTGAAAPDANWSNAGNWTGGVPVSGIDTQVNFSLGSTDPNQNIANPFLLNQMTFGGSFGRTDTGNTLDFRNSTGGTAPAIVYNGTGSPTVANQLTLTNNLDIRGTGTGVLRLSGPVYGNAGINKSGGFDLQLDNTSVNGLINVTGGRLVVGGTSLVAASLSANGAVDLGTAEVRIWNGGSISGPLSGTTGRLRVTRLGTLTLTGSGTIYGLSAGPPPNEAFYGASTLTISGGQITLTSTATDDTAAFVGALGSTVQVQNGGRLVFAPASTASFAVGSLTQPPAKLVVTGANSTVLGSTANLIVATPDPVKWPGDTFTVTNGATASWDTITGGGTAVSGGGTLTTRLVNGSGNVTGAGSRWTVTQNVTGNVTAQNAGIVTVGGNVVGMVNSLTAGIVNVNGRVSGGATINFGSANFGSIEGTQGLRLSDQVGAVALTVGSDNTSTTLSGGAVDAAAGAPGSLTKVGTGTLTISGNYGLTGMTQVSGGSLVLTGAGTLSSTTFRLAGGDLRIADKQIVVGATGIFGPEGTGTVELQNVTLSGGYIAGPNLITFTGAPSTVTGTTLFSSARAVMDQDVTFTAVTSGGSTQVNNPRTLTWNGGSLTSAGSLTLNTGATANVRSFDSSGVITVSAGSTLNNSSNPLTLGGGSRTYVGSVASPGGTLNLGGQTLELNGGLLVNNGTVVGTTNVNFGSLAMGAGTYGSVNVTTGGKFSPGNSPGTVTTGAVTLGPGSAYQFEINDVKGTPGANWDLWKMSSLTITAGPTPNSAISVLLASESPGGGAGPIANFDPTQEYDWVIAQSPAGVIGFSPDLFRVDKTGFANPTGIGNFSVTLVGTELHLHFSPVPEPGAFVLVGVAAIGWTCWRRRTSFTTKHTKYTKKSS
jgi:autotransporter-associated beta strand protein